MKLFRGMVRTDTHYLLYNCAIAHLRRCAAAEIGDEYERGAGELGARDLGGEGARAAVLAQAQRDT